MTAPDRSAAPIAASIDVLRRQFGLGRPATLTALADRWDELAGDEVARRSRIVDLRQGTLTVDAYDPATAEAIRWSKERVLDGVRTACPDERIIDLTVRVRRPERAPNG